MFIFPIYFMILIILKYKTCSLLSRIKNRYEYITKENNIDMLTEDLYDFEFTKSRLTTTRKTEILSEISSPEEDTNETTSYINDAFYDAPFYKQLPIKVRKIVDEYNNNSMILPENETFFDFRPTINPIFLLTRISSSKRKKTWPTYFPIRTSRLSHTDEILVRASSEQADWISFRRLQTSKQIDVFDIIKNKNKEMPTEQIRNTLHEWSAMKDDDFVKVTDKNERTTTARKKPTLQVWGSKNDDVFDMIKNENNTTTTAKTTLQVWGSKKDDIFDMIKNENNTITTAKTTLQIWGSKKHVSSMIKGNNEKTSPLQIKTTLQVWGSNEDDVFDMIKNKNNTTTTVKTTLQIWGSKKDVSGAIKGNNITTSPLQIKTTLQVWGSKTDDIFDFIKDKVSTTSITQLTTTKRTVTKKTKRQSTRTSCYMCGLNETRIPMPYCYYTFEGGDRRYSRGRHNFKVKCVKSDVQKNVKNVYYGPSYRGGCFKRYLDVGIEYSERGCRTVKPTKGKSFASRRLAKLELLISHLNDGCVTSPHASITPFSRAVSLFTHYHVCVCSQKYCNRSCNINGNSYVVMLLLIDAIICSISLWK